MILKSKDATFLYELLLKHPELKGNESYESLLNSAKEESQKRSELQEAFDNNEKPMIQYVGERKVYDYGDGTYRVIEEYSDYVKVINKVLITQVFKKEDVKELSSI